MYVVLLLLSVLYRFALSSGFSGEPIALRSGTPIPNKTSPRSSTHYMTLKRGFRVWAVEAWRRDEMR